MHIQMVIFTTAFMPIIYTRAPKLGRHNQYVFLASRSQRAVSWSSCHKPLEICPDTPHSECWSCLCSSDLQSHDMGQERCPLPLTTVQMEAVLLWSLCVYWFLPVVRGTSGCYPFHGHTAASLAWLSLAVLPLITAVQPGEHSQPRKACPN